MAMAPVWGLEVLLFETQHLIKQPLTPGYHTSKKFPDQCDLNDKKMSLGLSRGLWNVGPLVRCMGVDYCTPFFDLAGIRV